MKQSRAKAPHIYKQRLISTPESPSRMTSGRAAREIHALGEQLLRLRTDLPSHSIASKAHSARSLSTDRPEKSKRGKNNRDKLRLGTKKENDLKTWEEARRWSWDRKPCWSLTSSVPLRAIWIVGTSDPWSLIRSTRTKEEIGFKVKNPRALRVRWTLRCVSRWAGRRGYIYNRRIWILSPRFPICP